MNQPAQLQLSLFDEPPARIEEVLNKAEDQWFDRKSFRIDPKDLANSMIGFANADGGRIIVGIRNRQVEGVDSLPDHLNELQQAFLNFTCPPVRHASFFLDCLDHKGSPSRVLVIDVEASERIHRNHKDECYLRVGDENRHLGRDEERELAFDKHEAIFDKSIVPDLLLGDLDMEAIEAYADKMGSSESKRLMRQRGLFVDTSKNNGVTHAGWLLFGNDPPIWSYIRYLRYRGTVAETGTRSNLAEDIFIEGNIPSLIEKTKTLLAEKLGTVIRLAPNGRFEEFPTLPEFAWLEAIVNAVTHRSYSLQGDGVRVLDFDDRLEVHSPGRLPGLVRVQNIRDAPRYSRNPHIARVLAEMTGYVREQNEGVRRMFEEMDRYGLRDPLYIVTEGNVKVILYKEADPSRVRREMDITSQFRPFAQLLNRLGEERLKDLLSILKARHQMRPSEVAEHLGVSQPTARTYLRLLEEIELVRLVQKSTSDPTTHWVITDSPFWADYEAMSWSEPPL